MSRGESMSGGAAFSSEGFAAWAGRSGSHPSSFNHTDRSEMAADGFARWGKATASQQKARRRSCICVPTLRRPTTNQGSAATEWR